MARRRRNGSRSNWAKLGSGRQPIDGIAARVVGEGVNKPEHEQLIEKAKRTKDKDLRASIMIEAKAARKAYESRLTDKAAESRARRAMDKAQWLAQEQKW